jgi:hypothetical protein
MMREEMIKGLAAIRPLTGYGWPGFAILVSLDEVDLGGSQCVDRDGAQLGHSAPRRDQRQANGQRLCNLIMP